MAKNEGGERDVEQTPVGGVPAPSNPHPDWHLPPENAARIGTHTLRAKGRPRQNPTDYNIALRAKFGADQQLLRPGARHQQMRGFEDHYVDIVDLIVRATHNIWEEKNVGYIYDHYRHNARVIDDAGLEWGRDRVIESTIQFINAFPDIRIYADEVIWAGDDEVGFYTSHRCALTGTNTGWSKFGPPTGRRVRFWLVANCIFIGNENYEEWVIYNNSSLIQQLGFDLREKARELGNEARLDNLGDRWRFGEPDRLLGQGKPAHLPPPPEGDGFNVEDFIRRTYHYIWNWRLVGKARDAYAPNLRFFGPTDRAYNGRGDYQSFILSILAMFPDLAFQIDDLYWMGNEQDGYNVSVRWSLVGTHTGPGIYGKPTGRRIYMWGINQDVIVDGKIVEEWMMFNEFEVMQQIYRD